MVARDGISEISTKVGSFLEMKVSGRIAEQLVKNVKMYVRILSVG